MKLSIRSLFVVFSLTSLSTAIGSVADDGYTGYNLGFEGDRRSVVYETATTASNVSSVPPPDVSLNATVSVGTISILVRNLTAKVNLDAQVLNLLHFNAGVTASVDRVSLLIANVSAKVTLEARLGNLVAMISDVLDSIDLNPILAEVGKDVGSILNTTAGAVGGAVGDVGGAVGGLTSDLSARSFNLEHNILYAVNDYSGQTHTNRVLKQTGSIVDEFLDNKGVIHNQKTVGSYLTIMSFNGYEHATTFQGKPATEREYVYAPFVGLSVVSAVYLDGNGEVLGTQVLSESSAGGSSTVAEL